MAGRVYRRSTPTQNLRIVIRAIPWRLLLLIPVLLLLAFPAFLFGTGAGQRLLPALTSYFYNLSSPATPTPTPYPAFPTDLPQPGSLLYTVQVGDSCDEILTTQMRMADAGQIFSDVVPATVKALEGVIGQDCHALQPGMVITLSPQYPLVALGGIVLKVEPSAPPQPLPTPLINVAGQQLGVDCSNGCTLAVRVAPKVQVTLTVQTTLSVRAGSWVWAQAMLPRKVIAGFDAYPYVDPATPLNGMTMHACDFQVNNIHDDNSLSCSQLLPNTIIDDGGSWLFGVSGDGSLGHWHISLPLPTGTPVLLWLSLDNNGNLVYHKGNPAYRYDEQTHVYVRAL
ncbi:MAG TPA: hypothetical protein VKR83_18205 [Ktedonobacteraceae bacterium]|nr:hypothetical protein [Ktedonobacteraceae bacterium]